MKILITGSSGFIGSELKKQLSSRHEIVGYSRSEGRDILDYETLKASMKGCDVVVHLAAIRKPMEDKTFADYYKVNCEGTFNVAQAALENGVRRIVFTSSMSYYGIERGIPVKTPIHEDSLVLTQRVKAEQLPATTRPCDIAYSTSKVIAEEILANYGMAKKIEVVILRIGPTRKRGEYKPFGDLKLHLKIENALQVLQEAITSPEKMWYEAFSITDQIDGVDISKARRMLGYNPE
jgi:nucleoside-diphosphate-sugar epimerase